MRTVSQSFCQARGVGAEQGVQRGPSGPNIHTLQQASKEMGA